MKRLTLLLLAAAACLFLAPVRPPAARAAPAAESPWPPMTRENQWVMIEAEHLLANPGGSAEVLAICRRAARYGYTGILLWDGNLWERELPPGYMENAAAIKKGLRELGFTLMLNMCPRGAHLARWTGDPTILEPRPADPHPREKHYRYFCLSHPGVHKAWEEQIRRAEAIYRPVGWMMQAYNEIRVASTDALCEKDDRSPGEMIRDHVRETVAMIRRVTPGREVALWNDMIDPYHNALNTRYYHVRGGLGAAAGTVDKDVIIFSWNNREKSFRYWADRGNRQILPIYYDRDDMTLEEEAELVRSARKYRNSIIGWMYSSWRHNYDELEAYGDFYGKGWTRKRAAVPRFGFRL